MKILVLFLLTILGSSNSTLLTKSSLNKAATADDSVAYGYASNSKYILPSLAVNIKLN